MKLSIRRLWVLIPLGVLLLTACASPNAAEPGRLYFLQRSDGVWNLALLDDAGTAQPLLAGVDDFAPGPRFAVITDDAQRLSLWDSRRGLDLLRRCEAPCRAPAWSPDGAHLAWLEGDYRGGVLWVWNAATGSRATLGETSGALAWSPDGSRLAFATSAGLTLWSSATGLTETLSVGSAVAPAWSPDGARLAVTLPGGQLALTTPGALFPEPLLGQGTVWVEGLAWSPDGSRIALLQRRFFPPDHDHDAAEPVDDRQGAETPGAQPWLLDVATRELLPLPGDPTAAFARLAWSPDGRSLAVARLPVGVADPVPEVWVYDATTGVVMTRIPSSAAPAWGH